MPVFLVGSYYTSSYLFTKHDYLVDWSWPVITIFISWAIAAFLRFMEEYRLKQEIKKQFEHYLAPAMVKKLQKVAKALDKASKLHKRQSKIIKKHIKEKKNGKKFL